jgi:hypothetical protein
MDYSALIHNVFLTSSGFLGIFCLILTLLSYFATAGKISTIHAK